MNERLCGIHRMALTEGIEHSERNLPSCHSVHKTSTTELVPQLWGACGGYLSHAIATYWLKYVMIANDESEKNAKWKSRVIIEGTISTPALRCRGNYEKIRHSRCSVWGSKPCPPKYQAEMFPTETSLSVWPQSWAKYSNLNLPNVVKFIFFFFALKIRWYGQAYEKFRVMSDELKISSVSLFHPNSLDHIICPSALGCNSNLKTGTENHRR